MTDFRRWYYCVIQYCPDAGRAEAANVGVLLFSPCHCLEVKIDVTMSRVERFFGTNYTAAAKEGALSVATRLSGKAALEWDSYELSRYISSRANNIQLTEPRSMRRVVSSRLEECELLFKELVMEPKQ